MEGIDEFIGMVIEDAISAILENADFDIDVKVSVEVSIRK